MKNYHLRSILLTVIFLSVFISSAQQLVVQTFSYTGATQTFVIPNCSGQMTVEVLGAGGAWGTGSVTAGFGGGMMATMSPTPGALLYINVGGAGTGTAGGYNGGGNGGIGVISNGGGGGGASDIRIGGNTLNDRIAVGGGGGGAGADAPGVSGGNGGSYLSYTCTSPYGVGGQGGSGHTSGSVSGTCTGGTASGYADAGGGGGLNSAGGPTGSGTGGYGQAGSLGTGGAGGDSLGTYGGQQAFGQYALYGGGGGGGGYYGGAGGMGPSHNNLMIRGGGGGGGSTYIDQSYFNILYLPTGSLFNGVVSFTYVNNAVQVGSSAQVICPGDSVNIFASNVVTYTWLPAGSFTGSTTQTITVSPSATTEYTVLGTSTLGCASSSVINVMVNNPTVSINASPGNNICAGTDLTLTATGADTYTWTNNITNGSGFKPSAAVNNFTVNATDSIGCSAQATVEVRMLSPQVTSLSSHPAICAGDSVSLSATAINSSEILWLPDSASTSPLISKPMITTVYTIMAIDSIGSFKCTSSRTTEVRVHPVPQLTVTSSRTEICAGESVDLIAAGALTYTWATSSSAPVVNGGSMQATLSADNTYTITAVGANFCRSTSTYSMKVNTCAGLDDPVTTDFLVYPNPSPGWITLKAGPENIVSIVDIMGQLFYEFQITGNISEIKGLRAGIYFIRVTGHGQTHVKKLIVN